MDVRGKALLKPGNKVVLELEVPNAEPGRQPQHSPPEPGHILQQIADGVLAVHPSKSNITCRRIQMQVYNIQKTFHLATDQWSSQANERFLSWLLKAEQKRARATSPSPPALEDKQPLLALEDDKSALAPSEGNARTSSDVVDHALKPEDANPSSGHKGYVAFEAVDRVLNPEDAAPSSGHKGAAASEAVDHVLNPEDAVHNADTDSSSSSSSSTSSPGRKLRKARNTMSKAADALSDIQEALVDGCPECGHALAEVQKILSEALD